MPKSAPQKPTPKLRGYLQQVTIGLPPELVVRLDEVAAQERRSRSKLIEVWLTERLYRQHKAAA
jgi:predicted transcriptional regulator